ncbi:MAG: hypothetical protein ACK4HG_15280, partial [Agrobacterium albertimagni]
HKKPPYRTQLMHMVAFSSQFHRSSCSPLEVFDLHNSKGPGSSGGPLFLLFCWNNRSLEPFQRLAELTPGSVPPDTRDRSAADWNC